MRDTFTALVSSAYRELSSQASLTEGAMTQGDYVFRPALETASLHDYEQLFSAAFPDNGKLNTTYLRWQYVGNPHGQVIGVDAFAGDTLAAHYAIMPRRYTVDGLALAAALSINTATHPDHQGRGLFTRLAEATYAAAADKGVQFVIGAANVNSIGGFERKLGFAKLGQIRLFPSLSPPAAGPASLDLEITADWLEWRLANPSASYRSSRRGRSVTISTIKKGVPFHLGCVQAGLLPGERGMSLALPGLAPVFDRGVAGRFAIPMKYQPSPWHVIWRSLSAGGDPSLPQRLRMDGLSMDTF